MIYFLREVIKAISYRIKKSSNIEEYKQEKEVIDKLKQELSVYYDFKKRLIEKLSVLDSGNTSKVEITLEEIPENKIYIDKLLEDTDFTITYKVKRVGDYSVEISYNTLE